MNKEINVFFGDENWYKLDESGVAEAGAQRLDSKFVPLWTRNGYIEISKELKRRKKLVEKYQKSISERNECLLIGGYLKYNSFEVDWDFFDTCNLRDTVLLEDCALYLKSFLDVKNQQEWLKSH
jgi:hypothetical protein